MEGMHTPDQMAAQGRSKPSAGLRIAVDGRSMSANRGGVGSTVENLLRHMARLEPGLDLLLVLRAMSDRPDLGSASVIVRLYPHSAFGLRSMYRFAGHVKVDTWPIFHAPNNVLPRGISTRTVLTVHDVMPLESAANITRNPVERLVKHWFYQKFVPDSVRRADHVITVSRATREALCRFVPEAKRKTTVIYNGTDPDFRPLDPGEALRRTRTIEPDGRGLVLTVGNGSAHKNHYRAVEAYMRAFGDRDDMRFVLVRRFLRRDRPLEALLRMPEVRRRVILTPFLPKETLYGLVCRARIFFFPSWVEGFGLPILEAMACRTPVVTSNVSAPAEVAGDAALLADPFDVGALAAALRRADEDEGLRTELLARGEERVRAFSWERAARQTLEVYRAVAEGRDPVRTQA
jgi:glycosyltransferase involved in cell wall biosynthesis